MKSKEEKEEKFPPINDGKVEFFSSHKIERECPSFSEITALFCNQLQNLEARINLKEKNIFRPLTINTMN